MTQAGTTNYTYDQNGNETAAGTRSFTYDLANRVNTTAASGTTTTYTYDGDSNRLQASTGTAANQKTNGLWDTTWGTPQLALERDGANTLLRRYTYGIRRIGMTVGANSFYYHYDTIGSAVNLTTATGTTEWTDSYEPYGLIRTETKNDPNAPANLMKFVGEQLDPTGLYNLRARQYDPNTGRLLRLDPVELSDTTPAASAYVYVSDQPLTELDPSGMTSQAMASSPAGSDAAISATGNPNAGDNCTRVPDAIGYNVASLIDFSPSCHDHDVCYGTWGQLRRFCDDTFHTEMLEQCAAKYNIPYVTGVPKRLCNGFAGIYYYGVQKLGGESWPLIAFRYDPRGNTGCPLIGAGGQKPDVVSCFHIVQDRSYPPVVPLNRRQVADDIRHKVAKLLNPF
jgi:RHS repeat-associated protein